MLIKAPEKKHFRQHGNLCWTFTLASVSDTRWFGTAFALAVLPHAQTKPEHKRMNILPGFSAEEHIVRIGLCSNNRPKLGKSTFARGMLEAVPEKTPYETVKALGKTQNLWHSPETGWIRHYDCAFDMPAGDGFTGISDAHFLPSYRNNDLGRCNGPRTDIVEHPFWDRHDRNFHYIVFFEKPDSCDSPETRHVTVDVPPAYATTRRFQSFLKDCKSRLAELPHNNIG